MMQLKVLNKREAKRVHSILRESYGVDNELECSFLQSARDKLYAFTGDLSSPVLSRIRIDTIGLYFAAYDKKGLRLTIEGSQIIGPLAKKGIVELDHESAQRWMKGEDVRIVSDNKGFVLVRHGNDYMGSGRIKNGLLINFVPKSRRVGASFQSSQE